MPPSESLRVFISYGHDDYASLAVRIKHDLEALGHEVWFDVDRLKPGGDWERYIEEGFEFSAKDVESGRFLLLMTPHSVRRPVGYCLNELARAYSRNLPILPVMVSAVEPPLSICRMQYLDMRNCFPAEQHEEQYRKQLDALVKALVEKQVPFEGVQQRLLHYLQPITYSDDLTRHLLRFTGREWVMTEVDAWLASSSRVLWITGEAGVGKSAIAAWLCNKRPEIAAYHFCRFGNSDRVDARKALFSLAYQLSTQLPVYQDRLNASPLDQTVVETNVPAVFDRLFVNPLTDVVPLTDKPHVLLIDALDEATSKGGNELASLIGNEFDRLPPWLRVIVTSRPYEQEINSELQALDPWKLDAGRDENKDDIRKYLYREMQPFTGDGAPSDEVVDKIMDKSEGLFLYVSLVREELERGRLSLARMEEFPQGLGGVYLQWFKRYFPDPKLYETECRPALEAICAAREPLERRDLALILGWSEYDMRSLTAKFGSLFPVVDGRVRPFHQSVRDWLTTPERSGPYWIDVSAQEQRLADLAWREYKDGVNAMGPYCIKYGPTHLAACHRTSELKQLLLDPEWIEAKLHATGVVPLLADYDLDTASLSPSTGEGAETNPIRLIDGAIRLSSNVIADDPGQFASQMVGRLLPYCGQSAIEAFTKRVAESVQPPWLRPLHPALHPPGTALVRTLAGHTNEVNAVALSRDGRLAVSASRDKTLKVWEVPSGLELNTLKGHADEVFGVAVSGDGRLAVSASYDKTLKVWEVKSGRELHTLAGHTGWVNGVALSDDARLAVSASQDKTLKVWEVASGRELRTLQGHTDYVTSVALSGDGRLAVSASGDYTLKVWEVESGRELRTLSGHTHSVNGVALSGDGRLAVSASWDKTLKVWELDRGRELRTLSGHTNGVRAVAVTRDGQQAVSASDDNTLKIWELASGRELRTLSGHTSWILGEALSWDGRLVVSASGDHTLKVWEVDRGRELRSLRGHKSGVTRVAVSGDGRLAASASYDDTVKVWEVESGRELRTLQGHTRTVYGVALSRDGRLAVSASEDETLKVWEVESGRELRTLHGHTDPVLRVASSGDGRLAVSTSADKTLKVWDVERGRDRHTLVGHTNVVLGVALNGDGRLAVSASQDKMLKVWEVESGRELRTLQGHTGIVYDVALSRDGRLAISASHDQTLKVWEVDSGRELRTFVGHTNIVGGVALSGDGRLAASTSRDHTVKVWEVITGEVLTTFTCDSPARGCAFADASNIIF